MKKNIYCALLLGLISCNNLSPRKEFNSNESVETTIDSNQVLIDSAKSILRLSDLYIKQSIKKERTQKEVNALISPLMENFFDLKSKIDPKDTIELNDYRMELIQNLIDFQIDYDKLNN